jgi:hypothetical protein
MVQGWMRGARPVVSLGLSGEEALGLFGISKLAIYASWINNGIIAKVPKQMNGHTGGHK